MGTWGWEPWENDQGADWFSNLLATSEVVQQVHAAFELDVAEDFLEMWAAIYVVECFALPYIWPPDDCAKVLTETEQILLRALEDAPEVRDSETFAARVRRSLETVRGRIERAPGRSG